MLKRYNSVGITSIIDRSEDAEGFRPYQTLHKTGRLTARAYVTYTIQAPGVVAGGGSDHMIRFDPRLATNPYHPFLGMWIAITRKVVDGNILNSEQRITRMEALKMWTWNGAYLMFEEREKGSIETGKLADLAVISKDYAKCSEDEIKDIEVLRTVVGGKVVYDQLP
jgi:predicted amidohydrolase YtcJ